jgi:hypothetical protein
MRRENASAKLWERQERNGGINVYEERIRVGTA